MTMTMTLTTKAAQLKEGARPATEEVAGSLSKKSKEDTTYELAKDAKIEAGIDKPRTFSRRFER